MISCSSYAFFAVNKKITYGSVNDRIVFSSVGEIVEYKAWVPPIDPEPRLYIYAGWDLSEFCTDRVRYHCADKIYIFKPEKRSFEETNLPRCY